MKFKPEKLWALYHKDFGLIRLPLFCDETWRKESFCKERGMSWQQLVNLGYFCLPVRVSVITKKKKKKKQRS